MEYLRNSISEKRYYHSINVSNTAKKLAEFHKCDVFKAEIAGLVHDCARDMDMAFQMDCLAKEGIIADDLTIASKELLHGPAAVHICRSVFGIEDKEILMAVRYHTTGRKGMSLLEKVIYMADFIEPGRVFEGIEDLRHMAFENLDMALLLAFDSTIKHIISNNGLIHFDTIQSRNSLIKKLAFTHI